MLIPTTSCRSCSTKHSTTSHIYYASVGISRTNLMSASFHPQLDCRTLELFTSFFSQLKQSVFLYEVSLSLLEVHVSFLWFFSSKPNLKVGTGTHTGAFCLFKIEGLCSLLLFYSFGGYPHLGLSPFPVFKTKMFISGNVLWFWSRFQCSQPTPWK